MCYLGCLDLVDITEQFGLVGIYWASQKKWTLCICLKSQEPRNGFQNRFFLLKTKIHM